MSCLGNLFGNHDEPKQEHQSDYEPPVTEELYDDEGYKLVPGLFGGWVREADLKPVEKYHPPLWDD